MSSAGCQWSTSVFGMPLSSYNNFLSTIGGSPASNWWSAEREQVLLEPFIYTASNPGKNIRGRLIAAFNYWLNVPQDKLKAIDRVIDMAHNASLMIDDIEDNSDLRRGKPVAHKVYGTPQTINSANYVCHLAYQELRKSLWLPTNMAVESTEPVGRLLRVGDLDAIWTEELVHLHRGQGLDIYWRDAYKCPTEEEYIVMALGKASGVLRLSVRILMTCATTNTSVNYVPLIDIIGVYCQIRDDYMNLQSQEYTDTKGLADDISEGKFSFPVIHGIRENHDNTEIMDILKQRPKTPTLKLRAISYLRDTTRSFDYTLSVMRSLENQIRQEVTRLGGNPILEALLDKVHQ
ncbi:terpenoid synthase [Gyrodon lividus]|nr:terpenoid synthase [Gyrodon lividus]